MTMVWSGRQRPTSNRGERVDDTSRKSENGRRTGPNGKGRTLLLTVMFLLVPAAIGFRIALCLMFEGYPEDHGFFINWMNTLRTYGLGKGYAFDPTMNYPPFVPALLRWYGMLTDAWGIRPVKGSVAIRVPSLVIDAAAMLIILRLSSGIRSVKRRLAGFAFFAFNPALIFAGPVWGQVDMLHSVLMVLTLYTIEKPFASGFLYAWALLTKFQSVVLAPVIVLYLLGKWMRDKRWGTPSVYAAGFLLPVILAAAFFHYHGTLQVMLNQAYLHAVDLYPYVTLNAMNIWYHLIGTDPWTPDYTEIAAGITLKRIGLGLLAAAVCWIGWRLFRAEKPGFPLLLKCGAAVSFSFYMLSTQMHERYIVPTVVFLCVLVLYEPKWIKAAAALTATAFFSMVFVTQNLMKPESAMWMVYVNTAVFVWMLGSLGKKESVDLRK